MPRIDVSDVLRDPDVAGMKFDVLRRLQTVDNFGRARTTITRHKAIGSVTPSGDNTLARGEDYQTQGNTITVITNFMLRGPAKDGGKRNYQPDVIEWDGSHYVVSALSDYARYGKGVVSATCTSIDFIDQAPTAQ